MSESFYQRPWCRERQRRGPLGDHLDGWIEWLAQRGYAQSTGQEYVREFGRFNRWLQVHRVVQTAITGTHLEAYVRERAAQRQRTRVGLVIRLQQYLRRAGIDLPPPEEVIEAAWLAHYQSHLANQRGLAAETIRHHLRIARRFMETRLQDGAPQWGAITPEAIAEYLVTRSKQLRSVGKEAAALRGFLRYAVLNGHLETRLVASIPTVHHWRLSGLPECLDRQDLDRLVADDHNEATKARRDRAIVLLLARLGLRAIEVCRLTLDDVDWEGGTLRIHGKFGKESRLPLTQEVGAAVALYLRQDRPPSADRHVFLGLAAPHCGFRQSSVVSKIARQALARIGHRPQRGAAHLLRHSCATAMLRHGATLADIAQILRHVDTATTAIYAKVDRQRLQPLAGVWPEGGAR